MATRLYLRSSGTAGVTPSSWSSGWNKTTGTAGPFPCDTDKGDTALTNANNTALGGAGAEFIAIARWVSSPLTAQTVSGSITGVIRCSESNAALNATVAVAVKLIQSNGSDRAVLLAVAASDLTSTTPPEMATTQDTRRLQDVNENTSISLTSQSASAGDRIVIELGYREVNTNTSRSATIRYGDDASSDFAHSDSLTTDLNPWVEFSGNITFQVFAATAALTVGKATLSSSATFSDPVYAATAPLTAPKATSASSAIHVPPTFAATSALSAGAATLASTATHAGNVRSATAALQAAAGQPDFIMLVASATHVTPVYAATAALTAPKATAVASATHVTPVYAATAVLTASLVTATGIATHVTPVYSAITALTAPKATIAASATHVTPTYAATAALTASKATAAALATHVTPTYAATAALIAAPSTLAAAASTLTEFIASSSLTAAPAAAVATATHVTPAYEATAALLASAAIASAVASTAVVRQAAATLTAPVSALTSSATFSSPSYNAVADLEAAAASLIASAEAWTLITLSLVQGSWEIRIVEQESSGGLNSIPEQGVLSDETSDGRVDTLYSLRTTGVTFDTTTAGVTAEFAGTFRTALEVSHQGEPTTLWTNFSVNAGVGAEWTAYAQVRNISTGQPIYHVVLHSGAEPLENVVPEDWPAGGNEAPSPFIMDPWEQYEVRFGLRSLGTVPVTAGFFVENLKAVLASCDLTVPAATFAALGTSLPPTFNAVASLVASPAEFSAVVVVPPVLVASVSLVSPPAVIASMAEVPRILAYLISDGLVLLSSYTSGGGVLSSSAGMQYELPSADGLLLMPKLSEVEVTS